MSATTVEVPTTTQQSQPPPASPRAKVERLLVRGTPLFQGTLTLLGVIALVALALQDPGDLPLPLFIAALAVPLLFTVAAGASTVLTIRRTARGRVLAIIVDYLAFLTVFLFLLHLSDVFVGLDDLAGVFGASLPWLLLALVAFVLGYAIDAVGGSPTLKRGLGLVRTGLLVLAGVGFLFAIDAARGVVDFITGLADPLHFGLAVASGVILAFLLALWGEAGKARFGANLKDNDILDGVLLISPNLLGFLGFFAGPLLFSLYVSLSDWDAFSEPIFVGLQNYLDILALQVVVLDDPSVLLAPGLEQGFSEVLRIGSVVIAAQDRLFWIALRNILVFCLIAIPMAVIPALFLASLLNSRVRGIRFFRAVYFIPSVAGIVGIAIIWQQLLDQSVGWINYGITIVIDFVNSTFGASIEDPKIAWLNDPVTALPIIAVVFAWTTVGFNSILFLAGLQGVPADLYEAATIDGANRWQRFRNITLPSVSATTFFVVATTTILAFQLFTEPFILTGGGPNNATLTPVMYLYNAGFKNFEFGYASAVAWVLFGLIFIFTIVQYRRQRAEAFGN